jgi:hypothetical protein
MAFDEQHAQAMRENRMLREALEAVRYDKSFCCLKERTQEIVKRATAPAGVTGEVPRG